MVHEGTFVTLNDDECWQLLKNHGVGRVAWVSSTAGLVIFPVNYRVEDRTIVLCTEPSSLLAQLSAAESCQVTFQIDFYDDEATNGWSVMAQGLTSGVTDQFSGGLPTPWAPGSRSVVVAITPRSISGRAVLAGEREDS